MTTKVSVVSTTSEKLSSLTNLLPAMEAQVTMHTIVGDVRELANEIERNRPDLVVADVPLLSEELLSALSNALLGAHGTSVLLVSPDRSPEALLRAMRAGVREIVSSPVIADELKLAYRRQLARLSVSRGQTQYGRILAFVPAKGGSGGTFLSTNLAYTLAAQGARTALFDLNLHFGDAAIFLTAERPPRTIADLSREVERLDATFLESSMFAVSPNLWLLPSPESPEEAIDITPEAVERVLNVARSRFDFVIVDLGRIFEAVTVRVLDQADEIYIVAQPTLPFLHDAKRLLGMLASLGYKSDRIRMVLNRYSKGGDISESDVEKALGVPVDFTVPNNFMSVAYSINHGIPILKHAPRDIVSRALLKIAEKLVPIEPEKKTGWRRMFGGQ